MYICVRVKPNNNLSLNIDDIFKAYHRFAAKLLKAVQMGETDHIAKPALVGIQHLASRSSKNRWFLEVCFNFVLM